MARNCPHIRLHCTHSTVSDGEFTPDEMIAFYANHGYGIYAFTDHEKTNPVSTYDAHGMTLISGMEIHPAGPRGVPWHLLALGVPEDFPYPVKDEHTTIQECIDAVNQAGGLAFIAHPTWCGIRSTDIMELNGIQGIEVWNSACRFAGKGYNMTVWDELMDGGLFCNALAVDDAHCKREFFNGWTMVLLDEAPTPSNVMAALRAGEFYCTQGPEFKSINVKDGYLEAEFSPCVEVIGASYTWRGYPAMVENMNGPEDGIQEISSCRIKLKYDIPNSAIRLQIKDRLGHYAWCNPVKIC